MFGFTLRDIQRKPINSRFSTKFDKMINIFFGPLHGYRLEFDFAIAFATKGGVCAFGYIFLSIFSIEIEVVIEQGEQREREREKKRERKKKLSEK